MKKISITVLSFLTAFAFTKFANCQDTSTQIKINQVGYYPIAPKVAVITGKTASDRFYLLGAAKKDTVFSAALGTENKSAYSSVTTRIADFGSFRKTGSFILYVPGIGSSYPFSIKANVQHEMAIAALKGYYY